MLTGKQKRYLRSLAMTTKPLIQVGKNGLGDAFCRWRKGCHRNP